MTCNDAQPLIARYADDESSLPAGVRDELVTHVGVCAACRAALDGQREVAALLRARPANAPRPGLVARVSARIDQERREPSGDGWLALANWRRWSAAIVPVAAALMVVAYLDLASGTAASSTAAASTLEEWTSSSAPALLQSTATGEALIEVVLIGAAPSSGDSNVR